MSRVRATANDFAGKGVAGSAASLTLHALLCLLTGLVTLVGVLGLAGTHPATTDSVLDVLRAIGATGLADALRGPLEDLVRDKQASALVLVGGLAAIAALSWTYLRAFHARARLLASDDDDGSPGRSPAATVARVLVVELLTLLALAAIVTGPLAEAVGDVAGISRDAVVAWDIVKWPVLLLAAFSVFAALARSTFTDPRVLASSTIAFSQVFAAMVWLLSITGFVLYLVSVGSFEDSYGTIGSAVVLLIWVTLFSMLYYATPDVRGAGTGTIGAGAAVAAVAWLASCGLVGLWVGSLDALAGVFPAVVGAIVLLGGLWTANAVLLLAVRLHARASSPIAAPPVGERVAAAATTPSGADVDDLFTAVSRALQNDVAHETMLGPVEPGGEKRLSELELDLSDWGFTYGVAWATARAQNRDESDSSVAERALAAARRVFRLYCGDPGWAERIRLQAGRRQRRTGGRFEPEQDVAEAVVPAAPVEEPFGPGRHGNGRGWMPPQG